MNLRDLLLRVRALVAPRPGERELDDELAFPIERELRPSRQTAVVASCLLVGGAFVWHVATSSHSPIVDAGFWFEQIALDSAPLADPLTADELDVIESVARAELDQAFAGLQIRFSDRRDARYRVRVVQELRDLRFDRPVGVAGQSRAVSGFGGNGAVSFWFLANGALAHAPADADRAAVIEAIGRGIGRTAVHEFTHQLLPKAPIHDTTNAASYEHASAARPEHYYGEAVWDLAWPLLEKRLGRMGLGD